MTLLWSVAFLAVFAPLAVRAYRRRDLIPPVDVRASAPCRDVHPPPGRWA